MPQGAFQVAPTQLALPHRDFPKHAVVRGKPAANRAADRASALHPSSFAQLGRTGGYIQTVHWTVRTGRRHRVAVPFILEYIASLFGTEDEAAAACNDARATLWESGTPTPVWGNRGPSFSVTESHRRVETDVAACNGSFEWELSLRFNASAPVAMRQSALWWLGYVSSRVTELGRSLAQGQLSGSPPAGAAGLPPIFVAPWGTGPVVKSPSLMAVDATVAPPTATILPGEWRPTNLSSLGTHATNHAAVALTTGLARYVRTATLGANEGMYDAVALYSTASDANRAVGSLVAADDANHALHPVDVRQIASTPRLNAADIAVGWRGGNEVILALRDQNVVMILVETGRQPLTLATLSERLLATVPSWLHAQSTQVVDASGAPVLLTGLNWYGFDEQDFVAGGLDYRSYRDILTSIKLLGYNAIRLPFSNQLVEQNPVVTAHLGADPELQGLHALDIMDRIINEAGALGLSVILDDHRSDAGWSAQESGLWYTPAYPDSAFVQDWITMARRYAVNDVVVGADLRNEPHAAATWGDGNPATDWRLAAERAGNAVLGVNPHVMIMVEGVQFYGTNPSYWWGGNLMGVATAPVQLQYPGGGSAQTQLVYSVHDYGPDNCATGCPWFSPTTSYADLAALWDRYWGYITEDPSKPYAAPVWIGEFGTCNTQASCVSSAVPGSQGQWFSSLEQYLAQHNLGWTYWALNGTQSTAGVRVYGALDWYGLFSRDWSQPVPVLDSALHGLRDQEQHSALRSPSSGTTP